jgi:hypothetical protein
MRARIATAVGAGLAVIGAFAPWTRFSMDAIAGLEGESFAATGVSSGAGGWPLFALVASLVLCTALLLT